MERRSFLTGLGTLLGGVLLEKAIPFNRVWSFPKNIVIRPALDFDAINATTLKYITPALLDEVFRPSPFLSGLMILESTPGGKNSWVRDRFLESPTKQLEIASGGRFKSWYDGGVSR